MFGKGIALFKLFGFEIRIDVSWLFIAILITWSLALGFFPSHYKGLSIATYWSMGLVGALGLFASIVFHELCHSLVARKFGLNMRGITLFIFGGVAEMTEEPASAKAEFYMAAAGPFSSIILGFIFYLISIEGKSHGFPVPIIGILSYLSWINWVLAAFNLVPAFPLDGGRVLRSVLWRWKKNLVWATKVASQFGSTFGLLLIFFGILNIFLAQFINGVWYFLIGIFLRNASAGSYQKILVQHALEGETVKHFMKIDPIIVSPIISIEELVENYFYKYHYRIFPVVEEGRLVGCITTNEIKNVPRIEWKNRRVQDILSQCSSANVISPDTDAMKMLAIMNKSRITKFMVVEDGKLVGIITLKDLMKFISVKLTLEESES